MKNVSTHFFLSSVCFSIVLGAVLSLYGCAESSRSEQELIVELQEQPTKTSDFFSQDSLIEKDQRGVDMIIVSKDNDYIIELDLEDKFFLINNVNNESKIEVSVPASEIELSDKLGLFRYIAKDDDSSLTIQFQKTPCVTNFFRKMPYAVAVDYTDKVLEETTTFYGCGEYVPDYNLHNMWQVTSFKNMPLSETDFVTDFPVFELNMTTKMVLGTDGCNRVSAEIILEHGKIGFGLFSGTRMACARMEVGEQITTAMSSQMFDYELEDNELTLLQDGKEVLVLKAID